MRENKVKITDDFDKAVTRHVKEFPYCHAAQIAQALGKPEATVRIRALQLEACGALCSVWSHGKKLYYTTEGE
jgi:hypothetical protein